MKKQKHNDRWVRLKDVKQINDIKNTIEQMAKLLQHWKLAEIKKMNSAMALIAKGMENNHKQQGNK